MKCDIMLHDVRLCTAAALFAQTKATVRDKINIHHNLENYTCDPLKYTMDSCPILIVSICMGKYISGKGIGFFWNDLSV